jgi:hypothetical protein
MAGNKVKCRTTLTLFLANRVDYSSQKNETPRTPVRVLGRIAEQSSPECCSIPAYVPIFQFVNSTLRLKNGHVRAGGLTEADRGCSRRAE